MNVIVFDMYSMCDSISHWIKNNPTPVLMVKCDIGRSAPKAEVNWDDTCTLYGTEEVNENW